MFISPKVAIEEGWITSPNVKKYDEWVDKKYVSPNAIDFPLNALHYIDDGNPFIINENGKVMRGGPEVIPTASRSNPDELFWQINHGVYDGASDMYVVVPEGVACELIIRSSFNRNGIYLTSGLYDSGFSGHVAFALHNRSGAAEIGVGTRVGQIKFLHSDNASMYAGGYNHAKGTHHRDKT